MNLRQRNFRMDAEEICDAHEGLRLLFAPRWCILEAFDSQEQRWNLGNVWKNL